jgi:general secretion pathway protein K
MTHLGKSRHGHSRRRRGSIVVAALWIIFALATLASIASAYVAQSAISLSANDRAIQSEALARAALELTAYRLSSRQAEQRPTRGEFDFRLAGSDVGVTFVSEAARINLNLAPKSLIAGLFTEFGTEPELADEYAARVEAWRSPPKPSAEQDEASLYRAAGLGYLPRNAAFNHVDELWLVLGLPDSLVARTLPFFTVYSRTAEVNVLDASPEVLAALPGMSPLRLRAFLNERASLTDPQLVMAALGDRQAGATVKGSDAYRVRVRMAIPGHRTRTIEAVIMMMDASADRAYGVLSWRDDNDRGLAMTRNSVGNP